MNKLICFDLDGVLIDACEWHKIALNTALQEVLGFSIPEEDHYSKFNGLPTLKKLDILGIKDSQTINKISNIKQSITLSLIDSLKPDYDKLSMLKSLSDMGFRLACVTNSIRETTEKMLRNSGIFHMFDIIITNQDVKSSKPDPEGYNRAIELANASPDTTWIVEDSDKGLQAAYATGANVIKVSCPEDVTLELIAKHI